MSEIKQKLIYNPEGTDELSERKIINGNTTNLINLAKTKYKWASTLFDVMVGNFWLPNKVGLGSDKTEYPLLTEYEKTAYDGVVSFLVFLDSIQTTNLPNIGAYLTAPEMAPLVATQTFQEAIHSKSYAYIIDSIISEVDREKIYDFWRTDEVLQERNAYIANIYQNFVDNPDENNFARALIANYILEGLYFYNGFNFFYSLASRHLMVGTSYQIRYIQRDEETHVAFFRNIIKEIIAENPGIITAALVYEMFTEAVEAEIKWTNHIIGNNILGISYDTTEKYTKYMANLRLRSIGFNDLYDGFNENPYKHFDRLANLEGDVRTNFFEGTVTDYSMSSVVEGWDEMYD